MRDSRNELIALARKVLQLALRSFRRDATTSDEVSGSTDESIKESDAAYYMLTSLHCSPNDVNFYLCSSPPRSA